MLPERDRRDLAIQALAGSATISDLAAGHGVSRKFVYRQTDNPDFSHSSTINGQLQIRLARQTLTGH